MKTLDEYFSDWEGHVFGFGYGTGEMYILPALKDFFGNLENGRSYDHRNLEKQYGPLSAWLIINILCRADILEYGTSPRFGWLTKKGERLRDFVSDKDADSLYEMTRHDNNYSPCYPDACNCGPDGYEVDRVCANPFWRI